MHKGAGLEILIPFHLFDPKGEFFLSIDFGSMVFYLIPMIKYKKLKSRYLYS